MKDLEIPTTIKYVCTECGAENCKLWRQYQTFLNHIKLMCADCTEANQHRKIDLSKGDQCGWMIPAVPTVENDTFWGYTSVPTELVAWWKALPDRRAAK